MEEEERRVSGRPNGDDGDVEEEGRIARRPERRAEIGNNVSILLSREQCDENNIAPPSFVWYCIYNNI